VAGGSSRRSDLAKKATPICQKTGKAIDAVKQPANLVQDASVASAYFAKIVPIADNGMKDLRKLKPADDIKPAWDAYIAAQQAEVDVFDTLLTKAKAKDTSGIADLQTIPALDKTVNTAAAAAGVPGCGSTGG